MIGIEHGDYRYEVVPFSVSASGQYVAEVTRSAQNSLDSELLVYRGSFDPSSSLTNLVNGDNAADVQNFTILPRGDISPLGSRLAVGYSGNYNQNGLPLVAGTTYYAVVTSYDPYSPGGTGALGSFTLGIGGGPGNVTPVPEPATLAALGLGGLALLRRKRESA